MRTHLKDPFIHDNNSDIESPPLKDRESSSEHTPLGQFVLHGSELTQLEPTQRNRPYGIKEEKKKKLIWD